VGLTVRQPGRSFLGGTWTFETVVGTNLQSFRVTIPSQHSWLPITTTVTSAITPSNQPSASVPRRIPVSEGMRGHAAQRGNAETRTIDADFSGVDCPTLTNSTFIGHVTLTKTG
jgi:hypothetical protein